MKKKKKEKTMTELTKGVGKFLKEKELNKNNSELFEKAMRKAVKADSK